MPRVNKPRSTHGDAIVAANVVRRRDRAGWSNPELARRMESAGCPIAASALYRMEAGERRITVDELFGFARAFDCAPIDLMRTPTAAPPPDLLWNVKLLEDLYDEYRPLEERLNAIEVERQGHIGRLTDMLNEDDLAADSDAVKVAFRDWVAENFDDYHEFLEWSGIEKQITPSMRRGERRRK